MQQDVLHTKVILVYDLLFVESACCAGAARDVRVESLMHEVDHRVVLQDTSCFKALQYQAI